MCGVGVLATDDSRFTWRIADRASRVFFPFSLSSSFLILILVKLQ